MGYKMEYQIFIKEHKDYENGILTAERILNINEDQLFIIKQFANVKKDALLEDVYVINDCEFKIYPKLNYTQPNDNE